MTRHEAIAILSLQNTQEHDNDTIHRAYKRRAMELHPDRGGSPEAFSELRRARDLLIPKVCGTCSGSGRVTKQRGVFYDESNCPDCWGKKA